MSGASLSMTVARALYRSAIFKTGHAAGVSLYRRLLLARGLDDTARFARRSTLVLAPHPDDETLGCGATILRKRALGTPVHVAVFTDGGASHRSTVLGRDDLIALRREEALEATRLLGVPARAVSFLGYRDGCLAEAGGQLDEALCRLITDVAPQELLIPSAIDGHPDHRALNRAAQRAAARIGRPVEIFEYPVWFWDARSWIDVEASAAMKLWQMLHRPVLSLRRLTPFLVEASPFLDRKKTAICAYRSQTTNLTGEADWPVLDPHFLKQFLQEHEIFFASGAATWT